MWIGSTKSLKTSKSNMKSEQYVRQSKTQIITKVLNFYWYQKKGFTFVVNQCQASLTNKKDTHKTMEIAPFLSSSQWKKQW